MRIGQIKTCVVVCFLGFTAAVARGEKVPEWGWEKLFKEADAVLIVEATVSHDSGDKLHQPLRGELLGVNTTLKVHYALKGEVKGEFVLFHYQPAEGRKLGFGDFDTSGPERGEIRVEYLVFIKKRADGRFEPVSGVVYPDPSVRRLLYLPTSR